MRSHFSKTYAAQITGLRAHIIDVECDISSGLYAFTVVGLPDKAVEEARDRIGSAIKNSGFASPKQQNQKTVISLAPAHIKKEGSAFDLAMALAYLMSAGEIAMSAEKRLFLGELSLDGALRPIRGIVLMVAEAKKRGFEEVFVPVENAAEAALVKGVKVFPVPSLARAVAHLNERSLRKDDQARTPRQVLALYESEMAAEISALPSSIDFADIAGQESAKRAMEIAAAGRHNIALWGPPGTGKTMLAQAFAALLPPLSEEEMLEVTGIHSVAGVLKERVVAYPPFRSPHHTASYVSLIGGGTSPRPGEITLAHNGVLFLDEFPEFDRRVIETLRQPLADREIHISRAKGSERFPANFILVAAMNPCPCGFRGSERVCVCREGALAAYGRKLSGPIVDRIDMWAQVGHIDALMLEGGRGGRETTVDLRGRVEQARAAQMRRHEATPAQSRLNGELSVREMDELIPLTPAVRATLRSASERLDLSPRAYHKVIKIARTIADLGSSKEIAEEHMLEALHYRPRKDFIK